MSPSGKREKGLITGEIVRKASDAYHVRVLLRPDDPRFFLYEPSMRAALEAVAGDIIEAFTGHPPPSKPSSESDE